MGRESDLKSFRKQLRTVVRDNLEDILSVELVSAIRKELSAKLDLGVQAINKIVNDKLVQIDNRAKDVQNAFIRNVVGPSINQPAEGIVPLPEPSEESATTAE